MVSKGKDKDMNEGKDEVGQTRARTRARARTGQ